jgi:hypothetical protein
MDDQDSSSDEASVREEQAKPPEREADRKAQSAAQAATEELRNALQTKGEQAKFGPGYVPGDDDGSGLCVVQMGYKLLRPDCAPPGLQARHPRWLDLARSRHQRASRRLAGGEIEGGKGIRQPARSKRGGQCGDVEREAFIADDR